MKLIKKHKKLFIAVGATLLTLAGVRYANRNGYIAKIPFVGEQASSFASLF